VRIQGTFSAHLGNVQCTFRELSVRILGNSVLPLIPFYSFAACSLYPVRSNKNTTPHFFFEIRLTNDYLTHNLKDVTSEKLRMFRVKGQCRQSTFDRKSTVAGCFLRSRQSLDENLRSRQFGQLLKP
jgi:hypothetical protein